jgi:hypothetical protein
MGVGDQRHAPTASPPGKTRYPLYGRLGGTQGRSGRVQNLAPPPVFDPRTVQPVASGYTDWAIPGPHPETDVIVGLHTTCLLPSFERTKLWYVKKSYWNFPIRYILLSTTNKMQRYTIFFITVKALHVSGGFSAHHQELKNCIHSTWYLPGWFSQASSFTPST